MLLAMILWLGLSGSGSEAVPLAADPSPRADVVVRSAPSSSSAADSQNPAVQNNDEKQTMLSLVNRERAQAGVAALAWDARLAQAAAEHAQQIAEVGKLSHQLPGEPELRQRLAAKNLRMDRVSENVVFDRNVEDAHENFMSSPPHRENILDPGVDAVGIGMVKSNGVLYIVEDFAHRVIEAADGEVELIIANAFQTMRGNAGSDEHPAEAHKDARKEDARQSKRDSHAGDRDLPFKPDPRLSKLAEKNASQQAPDPGPAMALEGARYAAAYATNDPAKLPQSVVRLTGIQGLNHYSIGVYYARTPKYPSGLYWVNLVLFDTPALRAAK